MTLVVMDARGERRLVVGYAEPGGREAWLEATIGAEPPTKCQMVSDSDSGGMPLGDDELRASNVGGRDDGEGWWALVSGRAGPGIAQVIADVPGSPPIVATLSDAGWFAFWWPEDGEPPFDFRVLGLDDAGTEIAAFKQP